MITKFSRFNPINMFNDNKILLIKTILGVFILGLIAHVFCYFNTMYSHDALTAINQEVDVVGKISNGRFMQPINFMFRGYIVAPWLIGFLSLVWISLSSFLLIKLLHIKSSLLQLALCGALVTNQTLSLTNASYIHESDSFMLSLLFAIFAIYIFDKYKFGFIFTIISVVISCGFYQSYFSVSVVLLMILIIKHILDDIDTKKVIIKGIKGLISLIAGLGLYYLIYNLVLIIANVPASTAYNSLEGVADFSSINIIETLVKSVYSYFMLVFMEIFTLKYIFIVFTLVAITVINIIIIIKHRKINKLKIFLLCIIVALLPIGLSCVVFISKGIAHGLMVYSFVTMFVLVLMILQLVINIKKEKECKIIDIIKPIAFIMFVFLIINNIVISNEIYLHKTLSYQSTMATVTRIIDDIEDVEGYKFGETEVIVILDLDPNSKLNSSERDGYTTLKATAMEWNLSTNSYWAFESFVENVLAYPITFASGEFREEYRTFEEVKSMPQFPSEGYCKIINDKIVVKIVETLELEQ